MSSEIFSGTSMDARSSGAPMGLHGEKRRSPSPVWRSGGMPPENFTKNQR